MGEELILKQILAACDKHELRGEAKDKILEWLDSALLEYGLLKNIEQGMVEICGIKEDGDVLFTLTEEGKKHAEEMFGKNT